MSAPLQLMIPKGSTKVSVRVRAFGLSTWPLPSTSLSDQTAGLVLKYDRYTAAGGGDVDGGTSIVPVSLANLSQPWNAGGIKHIADGFYRIDLPDAACAKAVGVNQVLITGSATAQRFEGILIELIDADPNVFFSPKVY